MKNNGKNADKISVTGQRNSNIELLRIILMIMIIASHYVHNSGLLDLIYESPMSKQSLFLLIFGMWGKPCINSFILITGYFMCTANISIEKYFKLLLEVEVYNVVIYFIFVITGYQDFSLIGFLAVCFPIASISTNFVSCYLVFYLLIPFLNIVIKYIDYKKYVFLLGVLGFTYVFLGTLPKYDFQMNYISWFVALYFVGAFVRLHYIGKTSQSIWLWGVLFLLSYMASVASILLGAWVSPKVEMRLAFYLLEDSNKVLAVSTSFCMFMIFKNLHIKNNKYINMVASTTLGVLLIHANSDVMRQWLWKDVIKCTCYYESPFLVFHALISVIFIYIVCVLIDLFRIKIIEEPIFRKIRKGKKGDVL